MPGAKQAATVGDAPGLDAPAGIAGGEPLAGRAERQAGNRVTALSDAGALAELVRSRKKLERKLDHRVPWLAYPYGDYDARIERLSKKAGYKLAVTTDWGSLQSAQRPFALKRLRILDSTGVSGLAAMLRG